MTFLYLLGSAAIAWALWIFISLLLNYQEARKLGLSIIISPVNALNPLWMLIHKFIPIVPSAIQSLPFGLGKWARCTYVGWTFQDKYALHEELGLAFVLVTPSGNELWLADPGAAHVVLSKRKEYPKPAAMYKPLDVFGPSLNTVEGEDWQRHRRLTAPAFNEKVSSSVWAEATWQCQDMLQSWVECGQQGTQETVQDTARLALHVLSSAGFGVSRSFNEGVQKLSPGHDMSYQDALSLILRNVVTLAIIPKESLTSPMFFGKLRLLGQATKEFKRYMIELLQHERTQAIKRDLEDNNLLSALIRASNEVKKKEDDKMTQFGLTDDEISGNIFIYNLAGHETTANTVAAAIVVLAANSQYQEWLAEEIIHVPYKDLGSAQQNYENSFPKLKRCVAILYETLRLYGSIVFIPKTTGLHSETLTIGLKDYLLPANTAVNINSQAIHSNPRFWGTDALTWRPERWISPNGALINPSKGQFIPWADGPRICPGQKFAQVEFVAVMATLFREHRVRPLLLDGERLEDGKRKLMRMVNESAISAITLQMLNPRSVALVWGGKWEQKSRTQC